MAMTFSPDGKMIRSFIYIDGNAGNPQFTLKMFRQISCAFAVSRWRTLPIVMNYPYHYRDIARVNCFTVELSMT
jgi:hypothetical protein